VTPRIDDHLVDVSLDLASTTVDLAGIAPPDAYDGVSLVPLLLGLAVEPMRQRLVPLGYEHGWSGAVHGDYKYVRRGDVMSLFDLARDPGERHNLIGEEFDRAYRLSLVVEDELARRASLAEAARRAVP
jgi:arylsulfatase A-like enzyme